MSRENQDSPELATSELLLHLDHERGFNTMKFRRGGMEQVLGTLCVSRARGFFESPAEFGELARA